MALYTANKFCGEINITPCDIMMKFHSISNYFFASDYPIISTNYAALFQSAFTCQMSTSKWVGKLNKFERIFWYEEILIYQNRLPQNYLIVDLNIEKFSVNVTFITVAVVISFNKSQE